MDGETEQSAFEELVEMERQYGGEAPELPGDSDTTMLRQPLEYEDPAEPATRNVEAVSSTTRVPLEPYDDSSGATLRVSFTWGTIGGLTLDTYGPITISATRYFFARVTFTGAGAVSTVELIDQASATPPAASDTVFYISLGYAVVTAGDMAPPSRNLAGSQGVERCGYAANYVLANWLT